jgi:allophanate hydrolase subunit 2
MLACNRVTAVSPADSLDQLPRCGFSRAGCSTIGVFDAISTTLSTALVPRALKISGLGICRLHFERRSHKIVILGMAGVNHLYALLTWTAMAFTCLPAGVTQNIR